MSETMEESLAIAVLAWWKDHQHDVIPLNDGRDEMNVYDEVPLMVTLARCALTEVTGEA